MTSIVIHFGPMTAKVKHLKLRRGVYWYVRKIPADLVSNLGSTYLQRSLKTRDLHTALRSLKQLHADTELQWDNARRGLGISETLRHGPEHTIDVLRALGLQPLEIVKQELPTARQPSESPPPLPQIKFTEASKLYLQQHPKGDDERFQKVPLIATSLLLNVIGDIPISKMSRQHVTQIRDYMLNLGHATSTVRRRLGVLSVITQTAIDEYGMGITNPFAKVKIPKEGHDKSARKPFTHEELEQLSTLCRSANDTPRHIVGLLINTGARLGEIVGLRCADVKLNAPVPHILLTDTERSLKTVASIRKVPLIGVSLASARKALNAATEGGWLFPQYAQGSTVNTNSASQTINKWLRSKTKDKKTTHSFRHTMADRLRNAQIPEDIQKAVCGWGNNSVNRQYGTGYTLEVLAENLKKLECY